jgi:RimJ/RimL family protein N-acetyltransferase
MTTTRRLRIAPLRPADAAELFAALDHPDVGRYIGGPESTSADATRHRIERVNAGPPPGRYGQRWWNFVVRRASDDVVIGRLEATTYGDWGEIAYVFDPRTWGAGYATEGTTWLLQLLADHGISQVWAAVHPDNAASIALLSRLGFERRDHAPDGLASYDQGDLVFARRLDADGASR